MEIRETQEGDILVLEPNGRLDTTTSREFESKVQEVMGAGSLHLLVDFGSIDYVSSAGLRVLLMLGKKLPGMGGSLVLCSLSSAVLEVFEVSGFTRIFAISPNRAHGLGEAKKLQDGAKKPRRRRSRKSAKKEEKAEAKAAPPEPGDDTIRTPKKAGTEETVPPAAEPPKPEPVRAEPAPPTKPEPPPPAPPPVAKTATEESAPPEPKAPEEPENVSVEDLAKKLLSKNEPPPFADGKS